MILFYNNAEARYGAMRVLGKQKLKTSKPLLLEIQKMWNDIQAHPEKSPDFKKVKHELEFFADAYLWELED